MQPFVIKLGIVVPHHKPECHAKKWDFIFKVKVTMWAYQYDQNMQVSTISFISSKPVSLLQPNLKVSVNVSMDDILCIAEPFVTKPSMVRHYKPD